MATTDTTNDTGQYAGLAASYGLTTTGDPALDAIQDAAVAHAVSVLQSGQTLNPGLNITPATVSQFLQEAHGQVDPYYQQLLTDKINTINASLKSAQTDYQNSVDQSNATFKQNLNTERNTAAADGTAFSGQKNVDENYAAGTQNRTLAGLTADASTNEGNILRQGGAAIGGGIAGLTGDQSNFITPTINASTVGLSGARGSTQQGPAADLGYNPATYKIGSIGSAYGTDLGNTEDQYLGNSLEQAANAPVRSYTGLTTPTTTTTPSKTLS